MVLATAGAEENESEHERTPYWIYKFVVGFKSRIKDPSMRYTTCARVA